MPQRLRIKPASDSSLMVSFGDIVSDAIFAQLMALFRGLQALGDARIRNIHPAYTTLLIDFDPLRASHSEIAEMVNAAVEDKTPNLPPPGPKEIPVCYDAEFGLDLEWLSETVGLDLEEIVRRHHEQIYKVHFLGFSPGFAYMSGLPDALVVPRLPSPRKSVKAGSVAIAGNQAGIYPIDSPGGWRIIGRTPLRMFDPGSNQPTRLEPGDWVRFVPISRGAFVKLAEEAGVQ